MDSNNAFPHRWTLRLPEFDYSQPGAYFVTIVTQDRILLFGEILNGEMILNEVGKSVAELWLSIPEHFSNVELGEYVVMPNHIHGIISINQNHPHSGWFAQGLKAQISSQRLKALAFSSFKPVCVCSSRCPSRGYFLLLS